MTEEQIKAKAKEQFPNDEFKQQAIINAINWATKELQEEITEAKEIIREFVEWANWQGNSKCPSFKSIQDKAEQFLKDQEEEPCGQ